MAQRIETYQRRLRGIRIPKIDFAEQQEQAAGEDGVVEGDGDRQAAAGHRQPARAEAAPQLDGPRLRRLPRDDREGEAANHH